MNQLVWTRIEPDGPGLHAPKRHGDVGYDLEAAATVVLLPGQQHDIPTNVRIRLPEDCWGEIRARSSIARKGLQVDAGVLDTAYTGELLVLLRNMNRTGHSNGACDPFGRVTIQQGERIGQLVLHYAYRAELLEAPDIAHDPRRGTAGFGSTGA